MTTAPKQASRLRAWLYDNKLRRWLGASTGPRIVWLSMRQWGFVLGVAVTLLCVVRFLAGFIVWLMRGFGYRLTVGTARGLDNGLGLVIMTLLFLALVAVIAIALCEVISTTRWMRRNFRELRSERSAR